LFPLTKGKNGDKEWEGRVGKTEDWKEIIKIGNERRSKEGGRNRVKRK